MLLKVSSICALSLRVMLSKFRRSRVTHAAALRSVNGFLCLHNGCTLLFRDVWSSDRSGKLKCKPVYRNSRLCEAE